MKIFRKSIRFIQFLKHNYYYFIRRKVGDYPSPPNHLVEIGKFGSNTLVHTTEMNRKFFKRQNLNELNKEIKLSKENKISLILDGDDVLVKKRFSGKRKADDFFSELICFEKIGHLGYTPKLQYVDYKDMSIYMEYIDGVILSKSREGVKEYAFEKGEFIRVQLKKITDILHTNGIIFLDMRGANIIIKENNMYIFDFSDAIYFEESHLNLKTVKRNYLKLSNFVDKRVENILAELGLSE